jgi:hypothetical protein
MNYLCAFFFLFLSVWCVLYHFFVVMECIYRQFCYIFEDNMAEFCHLCDSLKHLQVIDHCHHLLARLTFTRMIAKSEL